MTHDLFSMVIMETACMPKYFKNWENEFFIFQIMSILFKNFPTNYIRYNFTNLIQ